MFLLFIAEFPIIIFLLSNKTTDGIKIFSSLSFINFTLFSVLIEQTEFVVPKSKPIQYCSVLWFLNQVLLYLLSS